MKVLPANVDMMKHLKHPTGLKFSTMETPVDWPNDQFTLRRLADGSIKPAAEVEEDKKTRSK